jgi:H+/Cl- antiporter ClcA
MEKIAARLGITTLTAIVLLTVTMWVYLRRHMPSRDFALFCLLTAAYIAIGLVSFKIFAEKIKQDRRFRIFLELVLAAVFVGLFYWFGAYVSPGMK